MRRPIIAGNWKMNKTPSEAAQLVKDLIPLVKDADIDVVVCPPYTALYTVAELVKGTNIKLGAQNVHFEKSGAFTGEVSIDMLKELGVEYIIIGHSERRQYFNETDETVNKKAKVILENGLTPIICVGESLDQREKGVTNDFVSMQTKLALNGIAGENVKKVVIAYEPIWAIGTGKTATSKEANDTIEAIRNAVKDVYGEEVSEAMRIQYGGSMNPKNATELMAQKEIDGGLIGGASLKAEDFSKVVLY
ncbi:MAG: triose-phosphate isomerase [Clostridia bacterium]|nr:triose-phosphate isomerase [Clostridia bacterium]